MADIMELFRRIGSSDAGKKQPIGWILAGLGNPGATYAETRHNAGFRALDYIAGQCGVKVDRLRYHALTGEGDIAGARVLFMKPETFMNASGEAIGAAADFYKIPADHVFVMMDDISFEPGRIRLRRNGSAGGHNGLKSIIAVLGSEDFPRLKIGVGAKPSAEYPLADWVLGKLPPEGRTATEARYPDMLEAVRLWISGESERAMNRFAR